jgi:hypothetical protein
MYLAYGIESLRLKLEQHILILELQTFFKCLINENERRNIEKKSFRRSRICLSVALSL